MRHFVNEQGEIVHQANRKNICRFNLLKACRITAKKVTVMCRRQYIVDHDFFEFRVLRCRQNSVSATKSPRAPARCTIAHWSCRSLKYVPRSVLAEDARLNFVRC
ncbi:hypothetical protein [Escherichia Stx1 converting phage]|uniref:hypothetical protein n=1 Tax=Escherichia Stx1 converting phage TaxID=194948 RepID=UPI00001AA34A|nr:hypothetical protein Stx1_p009 [Escherichia Stx1 converting phage]BAC77824.1 hypothetical protein [Escherichia Stx1 converting phage]